MPRWFIDVTVWVGTVALLALISFGVFQQMRPPTGEELVARERQRIADVCYAQPETRGFPAAMAKDYCGCVVDRALGFGGADADDLLACKQRAAGRMASDPNIKVTFAAAFPKACATIEEYYAGRRSEGETEFCQCMKTSVGDDTRRMALYAYAGSEPKSEARDKTYRACSGSIAYGSGWEFGYSPKGTTASMRLDAFPDARILRFNCDGGKLSFAALRFVDEETKENVWFQDETDEVIRASGDQADVVRLAEQLSFLDKQSWNRIDLHVGDRRIAVTASGATNALSSLLRDCAIPAAIARSEASSALPDRWEQITSSRAVLKAEGDSDAYLVLVCDEAPAYLAISPAIVPDLSQYADPEGNFDAVGVPLRIGAASGNIELAVPCAPGEEGAELSCYVTLDRAIMDTLTKSAEITVTLDGASYPAVATAKSPAVNSVAPACLRAIRG